MITTTTTILKVNVSGIPKFLKEQSYWINWKPFFVDGKARKLPTCGNIVLRGQYWDEAGRTFIEALRTMPRNGGLSLLLSRHNNLACIDIDDCKANDPRLQKIIQLAPGAWCEYSPSGNGIHIWGFLPNKSSYLLPHRKTIGYCGKKYEWYGTGRGITVTGHHICGNCLADLTAAVKFCESLRPKIVERKHNIVPVSISVEEILRKAFEKDPELKRMYYQGHSWHDKSAEDYNFCKLLWFWLGGHGAATIEAVFMQSALYRKEKGPGYPALTIRNAGRRWNGNYYGKKK